jgi:hypothetical protein
MQPSYELRFFCSQWDGAEGYDAEDEGPGDIDEAIREGARGTDEWSYQHCSDVDRLLETVIKENGMWLPPVGKGGGGYKVTGLYVTEEDAYEGIRESQRNGDL